MLTRITGFFRRIRKGVDPFVLGGYVFSILYSILIIIPLYFVISLCF